MSGYIGSQIPSFTSDVTSASGDFTVGSDLTVNSDATVSSDITVSGGIYLGGTGSANYLDDYEEGSYTATLNVTGGSISYSSNTLSYTKIGRMVFVNGRIIVSSVSSPTGPLQISLPFAVSVSGYSRYSQLTISFYSVDLTSNTLENMFTVESGSAANWLQSGDNVVWGVLPNSALSGNEQIQVSGFYLTDS